MALVYVVVSPSDKRYVGWTAKTLRQIAQWFDVHQGTVSNVNRKVGLAYAV